MRTRRLFLVTMIVLLAAACQAGDAEPPAASARADLPSAAAAPSQEAPMGAPATRTPAAGVPVETAAAASLPAPAGSSPTRGEPSRDPAPGGLSVDALNALAGSATNLGDLTRPDDRAPLPSRPMSPPPGADGSGDAEAPDESMIGLLGDEGEGRNVLGSSAGGGEAGGGMGGAMGGAMGGGGARFDDVDGRFGGAEERSSAEPERGGSLGPRRSRTRPDRPQQQVALTPLKAGSVDDNADLAGFVRFANAWMGRPGFGQADRLDVSERIYVKVVDPSGRPLPGAQVSIADPRTERLVWTATTYGDGRAPFYPRQALAMTGATQGEQVAPPGGWQINVAADGQSVAGVWQGEGEELVLTLDTQPGSGAVALDVCFLIDTTGSMDDEIERIKKTLLTVTEQVQSHGRPVNLRYGAVLYRDRTDAYVTRHHAFTDDLEAFNRALQGIEARGGGDTPESLNQGLAEAIGDMAWRDDAARVVFLIADAPPHMDYGQDVGYGRSAMAAVNHGIRVHTIAASGLDPFGTLVFRQIAQFTQGKFIFIEYNNNIATSAGAHGVDGRQMNSNNLDQIVLRELTAEIDGWGGGQQP